MKIFLLILMLFLIPRFAYAQSFEGKVVGITDGDTITVLTVGNKQVKVRLAEIDAPEKAQPFGQKSKQALSDMAFGKQVRIDQEDIDRYGRIVGRVYFNGFDINAELVRQGMVWVYRQYAKDLKLLDIEAEAKASRRGLWGDPDPIPPWEWRRGKRSTQATIETAVGKFSCDVGKTCKQMASCEEARFYLTECGVNRLDRDKDGIPCESICR